MNIYEPTIEIFQVDRPLHHQLKLSEYKESFDLRGLGKNYQKTVLKRLDDVFSMVSIADFKFPTIKRSVDSFDLVNPRLASRIIEACKRDLPSNSRVKACFKAIKYYSDFLKCCPNVHTLGQEPLYLPELYGAFECPINRFSLNPDNKTKPPNFNYLYFDEYMEWLNYFWQEAQPDRAGKYFEKKSQLYLMCVISGEMGLRLQELIGLNREHLNLVDGFCSVMCGKGSNGSGYRKREVPITPLAKDTIEDFLKLFSRIPGQPIFQSKKLRLSKSTAHQWMRSLVSEIKKKKGDKIFLDKGFGWHAFRRTFARNYIDADGNIHELKRIAGWSHTSTISHYMGAPKPTKPVKGLPLDFEGL